jgi:hypothetical protein
MSLYLIVLENHFCGSPFRLPSETRPRPKQEARLSLNKSTSPRLLRREHERPPKNISPLRLFFSLSCAPSYQTPARPSIVPIHIIPARIILRVSSFPCVACVGSRRFLGSPLSPAAPIDQRQVRARIWVLSCGGKFTMHCDDVLWVGTGVGPIEIDVAVSAGGFFLLLYICS